MSNATCLTRPRLFYALCIVSRITTICYVTRHFRREHVTCVRQVALDKWLPLSYAGPRSRQRLSSLTTTLERSRGAHAMRCGRFPCQDLANLLPRLWSRSEFSGVEFPPTVRGPPRVFVYRFKKNYLSPSCFKGPHRVSRMPLSHKGRRREETALTIQLLTMRCLALDSLVRSCPWRWTLEDPVGETPG